MSCLENNQHKSGVTHECKTTLRLRMLKEHSNYLLNMGLRKVDVVDIISLQFTVPGDSPGYSLEICKLVLEYSLFFQIVRPQD